MFHAPTPAAGRATAEQVLDSSHRCPVPEIARPGRTLRSWRAEVPACFDTGGTSDGGTEAINIIIEGPAAWLTGSATSATTAFASCSPPMGPVRGGDGDAVLGELPTHRSGEPGNTAAPGSGTG